MRRLIIILAVGFIFTTLLLLVPHHSSWANSNTSLNIEALMSDLNESKNISEIVDAIGKPTRIMPGKGKDKLYHYEFATKDKGTLLLVIIVNEKDKILKHRFYSID